MSKKITSKLSAVERAEIKWKSQTERNINLLFLDGKIDDVNDYFLGGAEIVGDLENCPLHRITNHYYYKYLVDNPSIQYLDKEDYFQYCLINYTLTINSYLGVDAEFKRVSSEELYNVWGYTKIDETNFYSSVIFHCKAIILEFIKNCNKDKIKANYNAFSLDKIKDEYNDRTELLAME